jgi:excisionase family DNA binding protein
MRLAEAATLLDVSPRTLRRMTASGMLPAIRLRGRTTRVSEGDLADLIAARRKRG